METKLILDIVKHVLKIALMTTAAFIAVKLGMLIDGLELQEFFR